MPRSALVYQAFDSDVFGVPFYRLSDPASVRVAEDIAALSDQGDFIADAKLPMGEAQAIAALERLGFRRICSQVELSHDLAESGAMKSVPAARLADRLALEAESLSAHAAGFRFARFLQDPLLPQAASRRLMERWIANSLSGRCKLAVIGSDFCSFKDKGAELVIDLLSCLETGRGHASGLLQAVLAHARDKGAERVRVVTEAENRPAMRTYRRNGFRPSAPDGGTALVLHLVRAFGAQTATAS